MLSLSLDFATSRFHAFFASRLPGRCEKESVQLVLGRSGRRKPLLHGYTGDFSEPEKIIGSWRGLTARPTAGGLLVSPDCFP